ncbi:hypothetical protein P7K49_022868, partial [Saguinus oedipus]
MAAKVVPMPPKPKRSFILRVPPDSKLGQDLRRDATNGPKTIHQLVLEHFLTFLPKPGLVQPSQKVKETLVIMKDVSSRLQNRGEKLMLVSLEEKEEELVVFEDLNVFHCQEECVSLDPTQQLTSEKEDDSSVGEMMLLVNKYPSAMYELIRQQPLCNLLRDATPLLSNAAALEAEALTNVFT